MLLPLKSPLAAEGASLLCSTCSSEGCATVFLLAAPVTSGAGAVLAALLMAALLAGSDARCRGDTALAR